MDSAPSRPKPEALLRAASGARCAPLARRCPGRLQPAGPSGAWERGHWSGRASPSPREEGAPSPPQRRASRTPPSTHSAFRDPQPPPSRPPAPVRGCPYPLRPPHHPPRPQRRLPPCPALGNTARQPGADGPGRSANTAPFMLARAVGPVSGAAPGLPGGVSAPWSRRGAAGPGRGGAAGPALPAPLPSGPARRSRHRLPASPPPLRPLAAAAIMKWAPCPPLSAPIRRGEAAAGSRPPPPATRALP